jgi:hypothetical protein
MANPIYILDELHIDEALWEFAVGNKDKACSCENCKHPMSVTSGFIDGYLKFREDYLVKAPHLNKGAYCLKNHLQMREAILSRPVTEIDSYAKTLLYVHYKMGRID